MPDADRGAGGGPQVTVLDGGGTSRVVRCANGEGPDTILEGFTITGGRADIGAGMHNHFSSPTVVNCVFVDNSALDYGGGMGNTNSNVKVINCTFEDLLVILASWGPCTG